MELKQERKIKTMQSLQKSSNRKLTLTSVQALLENVTHTNHERPYKKYAPK